MPEIRYESVDFRSQTIHGSRRRNVERAVVLVSPGEIGGLLGHFDCAQMVALRVPTQTPFGPVTNRVSVTINLDSVGDAIVRSSGFFAEDAAIAQRTIGRDVIDANISLGIVIVVDVEMFSVGRKRQAVGLGQVFSEEAELPLSSRR